MKVLIYLSLALALLLSSIAYGQNIQGIATYKTQRKMQVELDSTQMNDAMHDQIMAMLKKQFEREYTLEFTKEESLYVQEEKLDAPSSNVGSNGMMVVVAGSGDSDILYKNLKENRFVNQNEMFSKQFLIKDAITDQEWKLEKETKNIGQYSCFKATYTYEREQMRMMTRGTNADTDSENEDEVEMETITVTAWYTPQIPIKNGPGSYDGLPGLILEISDGQLSILCSKVVLNPKNGLNIKEPNKGKVVTQVAYDEIMEKKMEDMNEQFESDGRRGDGNNIEIRIGG
ncbi:MAG: GLPGLI family protein [Bacteroidetes bacterium]|nr:MAG: GLPGLI family protein [Bacteroidota bacterium]